MDRARLFTFAAVLIGVVTLAVSATGMLGLEGITVLLPVALVLGFVALRLQRTGSGLDAGWSGSAGHGGFPAGLIVAPAPGAPAPLFATDVTPARGSVARALSRVEARHLALNPWFAVGIGFWLILITFLGVLFVEDVEWSWWEIFALLPALAHPLVGCSIVAVHRGVTRARRDGADELFTSCPADDGARTRAFLLTAWVPLVATLACGTTFLLLIAIRNPNTFGPVDGRAMVDLALMALLPVGGTALGVALGRWAPWTLVPFVAVAAVAGLSNYLSELGSSSFETERGLASWIFNVPFDPVFYEPPTWERLAWIGGLTVAVGAIALLRSEHSQRVPFALAAGVAVAVLGAAALLQPISDAEAAEMADRIGNPAAHQTCTAAAPDVEVCVYEGYGALSAALVSDLTSVAEALPAGWTAEPVVFRQVFDGDLLALPEAVRDRLPDGRPGTTDLRVGYSSHPDTVLAGRFRLAAQSLGLPTSAEFGPQPVGGQARGVVLLWLATRGLDADAARRAVTPDLDGEIDEIDRADVWPARCHGEEAVLVWSRQDLTAARQVVDADEDTVRAVVHGEWERWSDPATTTDELLVALDLDPVGPPDLLNPGLVGTCG